LSSIADIERRVAQLEKETAALKAALAPRDDLKPAPRAIEPEGATIRYPMDQPACSLPTASELRELADIVLAAYPKLAPDASNPRWAEANRADFFRGFCAAFRRIASLTRDERPVTSRYLEFWTNEAEDWHRLQGNPTDIRTPQYLGAAIAAGDVPFALGAPHELAVGLRTDSLGRVATDAWRRVLSTHEVPKPVTQPRRTTEPAQPDVRVSGKIW